MNGRGRNGEKHWNLYVEPFVVHKGDRVAVQAFRVDMKNTVCTALMLLMSVCMYAQELYGEYEKKVYVSSQGDSLKYRLLRPEAEKAGKKYPLVLFLHGAGERGDDNQKQLVHGGQMWLNPVNREE